MNLNEFINICIKVNVKLTELNIQLIIKASMISAAYFVISTSSAQLTLSVSAWKKSRISNLNLNKKELFKKKLYFKCIKTEYKAYECFKMT